MKQPHLNQFCTIYELSSLIELVPSYFRLKLCYFINMLMLLYFFQKKCRTVFVIQENFYELNFENQ